jgi:signal transduction histidine kinase
MAMAMHTENAEFDSIGRIEPPSQRMSDFHEALLAMTGHDLRQPLQIILSANGWLGRRLTGTVEREYVDRIRLATLQTIKQLDRLVEALHIHGRAVDLCPQPVCLRAIFANIEKEHVREAEDRGVCLRVLGSDIVVMSDTVLLEGILRNLVRNALKYTPTGGKVLVGCRRHGTTRWIEVHDTGVGIPKDKLCQVFEAFRRLDSVSSDGLGLGLFIVRRAASSLGHGIHVRSAVGRGSCFTVIVEATAATL